MNNEEKIKKQDEIIDSIDNMFDALCSTFYVCYSVKELAYKVAYDLLQEHYGENTEIFPTIYCKRCKDKWKMAILFEEDIYLIFDIWWLTGMFGDCGLKCGNGKMKIGDLRGYEYIEDYIEDEEEE